MIQPLTEMTSRLSQEEVLKEQASRLLQDGYDGIMGLRKKWGHVGPYIFSRSEELQNLVLEPRYPLAKFICQIQRKWPDKRLGAVVRGCDRRFLKTLEERQVFKKDDFAFLDVVCSQEQAEACNCEKPIYNVFQCTGCWKCIEKCPQQAITRTNVCPIVLANEFDLGLAKRKAIYIPFPQAVPNKATRDTEHCLKITGKLDCKGCENACQVKAIKHEMEAEVIEVDVGNIIVATGYDTFDPTIIRQYGYGRYDNVITGLEFERLSNASGPTTGKILLKNGQAPKSVAIIHCVGSRNKKYHEYCSKVCCMYSLKIAHLVRDKTKAKVYELYNELKSSGKGYEEFSNRVTDEGVILIRGRMAEVTQKDGKLEVTCEDTLADCQRQLKVDMVVLSTALQPRADAGQIAGLFTINRSADGFFLERHPKLDPVATATDGVFVVGCCQGPKDIPETVAQAGAGASEVLALIDKGSVTVEAAVAAVNEKLCQGCGRCEEICEFRAPKVARNDKGLLVSAINEALCKGCGACSVSCPTGAISVRHFTREQILAMVDALA
jgi:heterodisulfide reductase subunit A